MLNNFIFARKKSLFISELEKGNILNEAIVFIEDTKEIWNHGVYFDCSSVDLSGYYTKEEIAAELEQTKQDTLISGTNIKTINGQSILGSGNISTEEASIGKSEIYGIFGLSI